MHYLKGRGNYVRLAICFIFFLVLFFFLHIREVRVGFVELNAKAKNYLVAQVDFSFPDTDATMILRQEAFRDVGKIYRLSRSEIKEARTKFENYLIYHPHWRKEHDATFEQMYKVLSLVEQYLFKVNITDARTYQKREELGQSIKDYYIDGDIKAGTEVRLPLTFWHQLARKIEEEGKRKASIDFVIDYLEKMKWRLYNDIDEQRAFKESIVKEIPQKSTFVRAGQRIVEKDEHITKRHMVMLKAMQAQMNEDRQLFSVKAIISSLIFTLIVFFVGGIYLYYFEREMFFSKSDVSLFLTILILTLLMAKLCEWALLSHGGEWADLVSYPIYIPFTSILVCVLLKRELALFTTFFLTVIMGISLAVDHSYFLFLNMITGVSAVIVASSIKKRKQIFYVCFKIWISAAFVIIAFNIVMQQFDITRVGLDLVVAMVFLFAIAMLLVAIMPILEAIFSIMTDMALLEYMSPTGDLLRRLSVEAPGTYQHSVSIGYLAEHAANAIGANGLFCRVTTLYHDIGKLSNPHYYTENQQLADNKQFNIHQLLTNTESAYIIKSHVPEGVSLAKKYSLPQPFIDIIEQHHGTTLIKFFYIKQLEEVGGNKEEVDEEIFRYPGPKPTTKESAIIMIADSVEATSRSLEDNSENALREMIDKVVNDKIADGQFNDCSLTFHELSIIKNKLVEILQATYHLRIKYPEMEKKSQDKPLPTA